MKKGEVLILGVLLLLIINNHLKLAKNPESNDNQTAFTLGFWQRLFSGPSEKREKPNRPPPPPVSSPPRAQRPSSIVVPPLRADDRPDAVEVYGGEMAVVQPTEGGPGAVEAPRCSQCVAVTAYDPETNTGGVIHFPNSDLVKVDESVEEFLNKFPSETNPSDLRVQVRGGQRGVSEDLVKEILDSLRERGIKVEKLDVLFPRGFRSVILNLKTGNVTYYRETIRSYDQYQGQTEPLVLDKELYQQVLRMSGQKR